MKNSNYEELSVYKRNVDVFWCAAIFFSCLICASQTSAAVVINEIYGAGGLSMATYNRDYVELYNNGTAAVDISGYSLQSASSAGTSYTRCNITATDTMIEPGTYFLIQLGSSNTAGGGAIPAPDAVPTCNTNIAASTGKLALVSSQTTLDGTTCPPTGATIVDFVGYGTNTNCSETANAPAPANNQSSLQRDVTGTDTGNNAVDFASGAPTPQSSMPTAAGATINGRITNSSGRGLGRVFVTLTGGELSEPIYAVTTSFGYYHFEDVPTGKTYILSVSSKSYTFNQTNIVINVNGDLADADFIGQRRYSGER